MISCKGVITLLLPAKPIIEIHTVSRAKGSVLSSLIIVPIPTSICSIGSPIIDSEISIRKKTGNRLIFYIFIRSNLIQREGEEEA